MKRSTLHTAAALGLLGFAATRFFRRSYEFRGRVVAITGGSRGFGLALARRFAQEGAEIALLARDRAELERARQDLQHYGAPAVFTYACDVRSEDQVQAAVAAITAHFGHLDVLVNNAGMITVGPLHTMTVRDFDESMQLHFWAPLYTILAAWPHLRQASGGGRIVNISSFGGKLAVPHLAPYCASKFALVGLSDAIRAEMAEDGIAVTTVCPGLLRTGSHVNAFFKGAHEDEFAWFASGMAVPGSAMAAHRAAYRVVEACRQGRPELILTLKAKIAVLAQAAAPNLMARLLAALNRILPHSSGLSGRFTGWQSRGHTSSALTRRADEATVDLNGLRGHPRPTSG